MAFVVCPSCKREVMGNPQEKMKCPHCWGLINPGDRRQGLVRGTTLCFNRYTIEEQIGRGGFAITYRVTTQVGAQRVNRVVKEYFPNGFAENQRAPGSSTMVVRPEQMYNFATYCDAFKLEASHLDGLHDIKGVVRFYDFFAENDTWYIVMQMLEGQDLFSYMQQQPERCLKLDDAVNITRQVLKIMSNVYRVQPMDGLHDGQPYYLIHRDLSLGNIFRASDGSITILDFGSARYMYEQLDSSNKAHYTPVEQILNTKEQGQYTDVYAIGKMFYFLLCGNWPHNVSNRKWIDDKAKYDLPPVRNTRPDVPAVVDDIIKKATQYDYHHRYQTADDFLKALSVVGKSGGKKKGFPLALVGVGAAGVVAALLASTLLGGQDDDTPTQPPHATYTPLPDHATTEMIREYAYLRAAEGATLCTAQDVETAVATLLEDEVVYAVHQYRNWSSVLLNWNGEKAEYQVENRWLKELTWSEAADYEARASINRSAVTTEDNHYLLAVSARPIEKTVTDAPTATPTATPTEEPTPSPTPEITPTPTPQVKSVVVSFVDEKGRTISEDLMSVTVGEDLLVEPRMLGTAYEIPQPTTIALKWNDKGEVDGGQITVQCQPTATPEPTLMPSDVTVRILYVDENGKTIHTAERSVSYVNNYFIPDPLSGYDLDFANSDTTIVVWDRNGQVQKDEFVIRCLPTATPEPTATPVVTPYVPDPQLVDLGMREITVVYGQTAEITPKYLLADENVWPELHFDSRGNVSALQQDGKIVLTGLHAGKDQLTVTDALGTHTLDVSIVPAVTGLSSNQVVLKNLDDVCYLDIQLHPGVETYDFRIDRPCAGVQVEHIGDQLKFTADRYVNGRVTITAGGRSLNVSVRMQDAISGMEAYIAPMSDLTQQQPVEAAGDAEALQFVFSRDAVQDMALLIRPQTLSGNLSQLVAGAGAVYNDALQMYQINLSDDAWMTRDAAPVTFSLGDSRTAVSVFTGSSVLNMSWMLQALAEPMAVNGQSEVGVELHPAVQVTDCTAANPLVAQASYASGKVTVHALSSGDTDIILTLSSGDMVRLPLSVRQTISELKAEHSVAYVGEELVVQVVTPSTPVAGEFTAALDSKDFTIVSQTADTIVLRAEHIGRSVLTVTDTFGGSAAIELRANNTVLGLSPEAIILEANQPTPVEILLMEGKTLPEHVTIRHQLEGLAATQRGTTINLLASPDRYINGTLIVDVDGEEFPLLVTSRDHLKTVTVYQAPANARNNPAQWRELDVLSAGDANVYFISPADLQQQCLIFAAETLSGQTGGVTASNGVQYDAENQVFYVNLEQSAFAKGDTLTFAMGEDAVSAKVYTGELVLNAAQLHQSLADMPLQAGTPLTLTPQLYELISLTGCSVSNPKIARAAIAGDSQLTLNGINSGEAAVSLQLSPVDYNYRFNFQVRQVLAGLRASATDAFLGETITVRAESAGMPLQKEFAAQLSGSSFSIVDQSYDEIVLRAESVGNATLTVTDAFGNARELTFRASSTASGLTAEYVKLPDGGTETVQIKLAKDGKLPDNIEIRNSDSNLLIQRNGQDIQVTVKKDCYVDTTAEIVMDGVAYPLHVATEDRLLQVSVWRAQSNALNNRSKWVAEGTAAPGNSLSFILDDAQVAGSYLIFTAETLSGVQAEVRTAGLKTAKEPGVYYVPLDDAAYKTVGAAPLEIALGDEKVTASLYTGDAILNMAAIRSALNGTLRAGEAVEIPVQLLAGTDLSACRIQDPQKAAVNLTGSRLTVTGLNSGVTQLLLKVAPSGEEYAFPVTVRQTVQTLRAAKTTAYVGEEIKVDILSHGQPLDGEFTCDLTGNGFSIVKTAPGSVTLRAERDGSGTLTVKDSHGSSKTIKLTSHSVVSGLSSSEVTLTDGEEKLLAINLVSGKTLNSQVFVQNPVKNLDVTVTGSRVALKTKPGAYAEGTVSFTVEGITYTLDVHTQDRITECSVSYPDPKNRDYAALLQKGTLYLNVKTLSGKLDALSITGPWKIDAVNGSKLTLVTTGDVKRLAAPQALKVLLNGREERGMSISYPNAVLSLPAVLASRKAGSTLTLSLGQNGFDTLFGTLKGISCTADGAEVIQPDDTTLQLTRSDAGTATLRLKEDNGREFTAKAAFDAYLKTVKVNNRTVSAGSSIQLSMTEEGSCEAVISVSGGSQNQLVGFVMESSDPNCVKLSRTGSTVTLTALAKGSSTITLGDQYGTVTLEVKVAELWRFPNSSSTADEIREVSTALGALGFRKGRTSSTWNDAMTDAVKAWKASKGYPSDSGTLSEDEYYEVLSEGGVAFERASVTATPAPAFKPRTGETAALTDIAAGEDGIFLLDAQGWVIVLRKDGSVADAFPAEGGTHYTSLYDTGDVPMAEDGGQMYTLHSASLSNVVPMDHSRNSTYMQNMQLGLQSSTINKIAAMTSKGMIIVMAETQDYSPDGGATITTVNAGRALYSLNGKTLKLLQSPSNKIVAVAADQATFALATDYRKVYLLNATSAMSKKLTDGKGGQLAEVTITMDAKPLQKNVAQIALSAQHIALRLSDGSVIVGGAEVPGKLGQPIRERDTFAECAFSGKARDIALSDTTLYVLTTDGKLLARGDGSPDQFRQLLDAVTAISADDQYGYAITSDGKVYRINGCSVTKLTDQVKLP